MGALENPNAINAAAVIVPVPAPPFTTSLVGSRGVQSFTRLSAGQYEIVLERALSFEEGVPRVSVPANTRLFAGVQIVSPGVVRVSVLNGDDGLPIDPDAFYFTMLAAVEGQGAGPDLPLAAVPPPPAAGGDVSGPGSSTNTAIARWNGTTGETLSDSTVTLDGSGNFASAGTYNGLALIGTSSKVGVGEGAGNLSTSTGLRTTAIGSGALSALTSGNDNTAIGNGALNLCTIAINNTAIGRSALGGLVNGNGNVAVGFRAGLVSTGGSDNVFIGNSAALNALAVSNTVAIGRLALGGLTTGLQNVAVGQAAGGAITTQGNNTLIGNNAGPTVASASNIVIGASADVPEPAAGSQFSLGNAIVGSLVAGAIKARIGGPIGTAISTQTEVAQIVNEGADTVPVLALTTTGANGAKMFVHVGNRDPNAAVTATPGSLYCRATGAATSSWYINRSTGPGTAWSLVTAVP